MISLVGNRFQNIMNDHFCGEYIMHTKRELCHRRLSFIINILFQAVSWLSFLGPFDSEVWALIAGAVLICGLLYGVASFVVNHILPPLNKTSQTNIVEEFKVTSFFTVGACLMQGMQS